MPRLVVIALLFALLTPPAFAAEPDWQSIAQETRRVTLPGPRPSETRYVLYWRPAGVSGPLPTLYLADGMAALKLTLADLREDIVSGRAEPIMIVAMEPSQQPQRAKEYVRGETDTSEWDMHFAWFVGTVLPWAERYAGASPRPSERGVGGVSNGADFAIAAAAQRPDLFAAVMAHSPVNEVDVAFRGARSIRWALTTGRGEYGGGTARLQQRIVEHIDNAAPLRLCQGPGGHDEESWRALSPGTIAWLFKLAPAASIDTAVEQRSCTERNDT